MSSYIDRNKAINALDYNDRVFHYADASKEKIVNETVQMLCRVLCDLPAADVQPVKRGKWDGYVCSECNVCADYFISGDFYFDEKPNFCPNCGADMRGDDDV